MGREELVRDGDGKPRYTNEELFEAGISIFKFKGASEPGGDIDYEELRELIEHQGFLSLERQRRQKPIAFAIGRLIRKIT